MLWEVVIVSIIVIFIKINAPFLGDGHDSPAPACYRPHLPITVVVDASSSSLSCDRGRGWGVVMVVGGDGGGWWW